MGELEIRASTRGKDHSKTYRSLVQSDGYFEFDEISAGSYTFRIYRFAIEQPEDVLLPSAYHVASQNLGIDVQVSVAEGQTRDLGVVEVTILKKR